MVDLTALEQAAHIYVTRGLMDAQGKQDAAVALIEWKLFSNRQISMITDVPLDRVNALSTKTDKQGGSLDVAELPAIRDLWRASHRGGDVKAEVVRILAGKTSSTMLARLSGLSQTTISRWSRTAA